MSKNKSTKFREFDAFENTLDFTHKTAGKWNELFGNDNPVVLELACGKGDYALGLARMNPGINYVGIDIKGNRMWKGAGAAMAEGIKNVRFLRIQIDFITEYFAENEVSNIWITFPDPQPAKARKRLSSERFLDKYRRIAKADCHIHIKTDSDLFYESSIEVATEQKLPFFTNYPDVYALDPVPEFLQIKTFYENIWLKEGRTIKYLEYGLNVQ